MEQRKESQKPSRCQTAEQNLSIIQDLQRTEIRTVASSVVFHGLWSNHSQPNRLITVSNSVGKPQTTAHLLCCEICSAKYTVNSQVFVNLICLNKISEVLELSLGHQNPKEKHRCGTNLFKLSPLLPSNPFQLINKIWVAKPYNGSYHFLFLFHCFSSQLLMRPTHNEKPGRVLRNVFLLPAKQY